MSNFKVNYTHPSPIPLATHRLDISYLLSDVEGPQEDCLYVQLNPREHDSMIFTPLLQSAQEHLAKRLGWDLDKVTSFRMDIHPLK